MKKKILIVAAVLTYGALQAQEDSIINLEEVSVTATKFPKKLSETGKVVTIITAEELSHQGGKDLSQILGEQSAVYVNGSGSNPGKDKAVYIRGANYGYTLILINGVPVIDPTGVGGAFDLRMLPVEQIDRIEILRGAQSTLYGSDAVAGVINIITKTGKEKPANFYGGLSYGTNHTLKASAGIGGNFKGSSYNVGLVHNETRGISEAVNEIDTSVRNGLLLNAISMDVNANVARGLYIKPFFRYSYYSGSIPDDAFMPANNKYTASLLGTGSQAVYNFTNGSITALFAFDEVKRTYNYSYGAYDYNGNKKTAEIFSNYNFTNHIQALAGLRYDVLLMKNPTPTVADTSVNITSPYISFFIKDLYGFNLELGSRLNHHSKYGDNFTYSINPSYLLQQNVKLFVNYATAFRAPNLSELYGQYGANPDLKPEKSNTFEGGFTINTHDKKFDLRAVYFTRKTKDVIAYNSSYTYTNYNEQKDHGFEVEPTIRFNEDISLKMFYNYVDGEVTAQKGTTDTTYNNLFRRPKHSFGATLNYQVTPSLFVNTNARYAGKRYELFADPRNGYATSLVSMNDYLLWDIYAEYALLKNKFKIFGQVNNILDKDYNESYGYATLGRTFTAGFRFNF